MSTMSFGNIKCFNLGTKKKVTTAFLFLLQDGIVSPQDVDTIMSQGLGMRYAFMGPWETGYLNANGKSGPFG